MSWLAHVALEVRALCLFLPALASGCASAELAEETHAASGPWLTPCVDASDCPVDASCVHSVCTIACDVRALEACGSLSSDAVCDTERGSCEVPCAVATTCTVLGAGYVCAEGRCHTDYPDAP
jgi:hypothetical protein